MMSAGVADGLARERAGGVCVSGDGEMSLEEVLAARAVEDEIFKGVVEMVWRSAAINTMDLIVDKVLKREAKALVRAPAVPYKEFEDLLQTMPGEFPSAFKDKLEMISNNVYNNILDSMNKKRQREAERETG